MWPYLLEEAKNWREDYHAKDPAAQVTSSPVDAKEYPLNYVQHLDEIVSGKVNGGFNYVSTVMITNEEVSLVNRRYFATAGKGILKPGSINIPIAPEWKTKAGNGMGTLCSIEEFINKLKERTGTDLLQKLEAGQAALLVHTAGDGTRMALGRCENNKPLIEIASDIAIVDGAIKQSQGIAVPGKLLTTWGDQFIFAAEAGLQENIAKLSQDYQVLLFGIDFPEEQFTKEDATSFGWQVIADGHKILGFDDTRDYDLIKKRIEELKAQGHKVAIRWNMGGFALSAEVIKMLFEAFADELSRKEGFFNSDEIWQTWVAKDRETYIQEFSKGKPDKAKQAEYIWDKVTPIKEALITKYGPDHLMASVNLGTKETALQFDFGTNQNYWDSMRKLLTDNISGQAIRAFLKLEKTTSEQGGLSVEDSVLDHSQITEGFITNSIVENSTIKQADVKDSIIQHSTLNKVKGTGGVVFNVVDDGEIAVEEGVMIFDFFHPQAGRLRFRFKVGEEKLDKKLWWTVAIHGNPMSLEELSNSTMHKVSIDEIIAAKENFINSLKSSSPVKLSDHLPLTLLRKAGSVKLGYKWPAAKEVFGLSLETQVLSSIPYLASSLFDNKYPQLSLLYTLAYLRQLKDTNRKITLEELNTIGYAQLSTWLNEHYNNDLAASLTAVNLKLQLSADNDKQITILVHLHDRVISLARSLRIGLEAEEDDLSILSAITNIPEINQVIFGLRPAALLNSEVDLKALQHTLWLLSQIEERAYYRIVELVDGSYYIYNEYLLKYLAAQNKQSYGLTREGLESLIKIDMVAKSGLFYELARNNSHSEYRNLVNNLSRNILLQEPDKTFSRWDNERLIYRHSELACRVFEIEKPAADTIFIATGMRPEGLEGQLTAEVENHTIFNSRVDIVVIDGSDEESRAVFERDRVMLKGLNEKFGTHFLHLDANNHWQGDIANYRARLVDRFNHELASGTIDEVIKEILTKRGVILDGATVDAEAMLGYLRKNVFRHISGVRNYTVLLGKGLKVIMNIDDDAPPETYVLFRNERDAIREECLAQRSVLMTQMIEEAALRLGEEITDEAGLYQILADPVKRAKLKDIEDKYFAYSPHANTGLIPQAMRQIKKKTDLYLKDKNGIGQELELGYQRYESLAKPLADYMVCVSDFTYPQPRTEKKDHTFKVLPVNTIRAARLVGQIVEDTYLPVMGKVKDYRGTMSVPAQEDEREKMLKKKIVDVAYPFILDHDTSGFAQFIRFMELDEKIAKNLQHANQSALVVEGISGFAADTYVIFNRAAFENILPMPSIGRDLRLEEPPYIVWVAQPVMQDTITMCYAPVAGGQQRSIGERLYIISNQDLTETIGGVARASYEQAVRNYYQKLSSDESLRKEGDYATRLKALGKCYMDVVKGFSLNETQVKDLLHQREVRAKLIAELGRQRAEKAAQLKDALLSETKDQNRINSLEQQIRDMDLIFTNYAQSFFLYQIKKVKDESAQGTYSFYQAANDGYMYEITVKDNTLYWQAVEADLYVRDIAGGGVESIRSNWKEIEGKTGEVELADFKPGKLFEVEPGKAIILKELPPRGLTMVTPFISQELTKAYLAEVQKKVSDFVLSDGELICMWPYLLEEAKNWREDYHAKDPAAQVTSSPVD
ncbi:MAG: hypothetical protein KJ737_28240, partial [Proteobacteria bacterium]|nr:hypothetical protein [Pseudomonadota bacterium]